MTDQLKKYIVSGIQDVLSNQLSKKGGNQQQQQPQGEQYPQGGGSQYPGNQSSYGNAGYPGGTSGSYGNGGYPGGGNGQYPGSSPYPSGNNGPYPGAGNSAPYPGADTGNYGNAGYPGGNTAAPYPGANSAPYPSAGTAGYPQPPQIGFSGQPQPGGYGFQQPGSQPAVPYGQQQPQGYGQQQQYGSGFGGSYPPPPQHGGYGGPQQFGGGGGFQGQSQPMFGNPTITAVQYNPNQDAEALRKAMKGFGCNNSSVIRVLCHRTNDQRQEIAKAFKVMYGKDLIKTLKSELHGDFEDLIIALMEPAAVYEAKQLRKAMEGLGTKESVLIEIMTTRTNYQIAVLKQTYQNLYKRDLEKDLIGETSGWFQRLLISLCAGGRDESQNVDPLRANQDATRLYKAGERRLGTDEAQFNAILASQNYSQLRLVFDEYRKISGHEIERAIDSEFSGDIRDGMMALVQVARNKAGYLATLLYNSMKGAGTRDTDLIRLVVSRAEVDLADVREAFRAQYKTTLEAMIQGDTSGSYKEALITLVKGNH